MSDQVRPFADWLREQARGRTHHELSEKLNELVQAVQETGKSGTLTLTVKIDQAKGMDALRVSDTVKVQLPGLDRPVSLFFPDEHHNLRRDDPSQLSFESLREVPAERSAETPLREVR